MCTARASTWGCCAPKTHVHLLDRFAGLLPLRTQVAAQVAELRRTRGDLERLRHDARTVAQRLDLLSFQVEEIRTANLRPAEDQELESERRRLANAEALNTLAQAAAGILHRGDGELPSAVDLVSEAVGKLERLARIDPDLATQRRRRPGAPGATRRPGAHAGRLRRRAGIQPRPAPGGRRAARRHPHPQTQVRRHHRADQRLRRPRTGGAGRTRQLGGQDGRAGAAGRGAAAPPSASWAPS